VGLSASAGQVLDAAMSYDGSTTYNSHYTWHYMQVADALGQR
jgi:hypothetical protein